MKQLTGGVNNISYLITKAPIKGHDAACYSACQHTVLEVIELEAEQMVKCNDLRRYN